MGWFKNIFGINKRLSEMEDPKLKKKNRKARWERPVNSLTKNQLTAEQFQIVRLGEEFVQGVCERKGWNFLDFEGPFVIVPDEADLEFLEQMRKERGKGPDYKLWMVEYGNANGFLRGLGDNEGKFHLIIDGYYG